MLQHHLRRVGLEFLSFFRNLVLRKISLYIYIYIYIYILNFTEHVTCTSVFGGWYYKTGHRLLDRAYPVIAKSLEEMLITGNSFLSDFLRTSLFTPCRDLLTDYTVHQGRCPKRNVCRHRKRTRRHEFKSGTRLIAFPRAVEEGMNLFIIPPTIGK